MADQGLETYNRYLGRTQPRTQPHWLNFRSTHLNPPTYAHHLPYLNWLGGMEPNHIGGGGKEPNLPKGDGL